MKNEFPVVSVIVPNYNYAIYLDKRLKSILAQSYKDFELILLDDASNDNSVEVLDCYKVVDCVTHLVINEVNSGSPYWQWKKGIDLARGKYVWIAESDDWADPYFLEVAVAHLEKYTNAAFCFIGSHIIDENGANMNVDYDKWNCRKYAKGHAVFSGTEYLAHNLYWMPYIYNASGTVFRRESYSRMENGSFLRMRYCGDCLFWAQMALQGDVIEIYQKLNYFRLHSRSTTVRGQRLGESLSEDMDVVRFIGSVVPIGAYKRMLRCGDFYKRIRRLKINETMKQKLFAQLDSFSSSPIRCYWLERMHKIVSTMLPWILTRRRDRL